MTDTTGNATFPTGRNGWSLLRRVPALWVVVSLTAGPPAQAPEWRLVKETVYASPRAPLTRIRQITVDEGGSVYVLDSQSPGIEVFDPDGPYRGSIGRSGGGPGEFRSLGWMGWVGDSLWVTDPASDRASFFTADGSLIRDEPVPKIVSSKTGLEFDVRAVFPGHCWLLVETYYAGRSQMAVEGLGQTVLRECAGRRAPDTVTTLDVKNRWLVVKAATSPLSQYNGFQPWTNADAWNVSDTGNRIAVVQQPPPDASVSGTYRVEVFDSAGHRLRATRIGYHPIPLTRARVKRWIDSMLAGPVGKIFPSKAAGRRALGEQVYRPAYVPPVRRVVLGRDGTIWIERGAVGDSAAWDILDPDARPIARLKVPSNVAIHEVRGSSVWAAVSDSLNVPAIVRYRISR